MSQTIRDAFAKTITQNHDSQINLAYAALLFAEYLTQPIDSSYYLALLDEMAELAEAVVKPGGPDLRVIGAFNHYMFDQLKFLGNERDYYYPGNSFLNQVLDSKTGIPISLSAIYLEIGWRLGLPLWGVGMPRHFLVGYGLPHDPIYIDPFNQGKVLGEDDCLAICHVSPQDRLAFRSDFLQPATKKSILFRMLLNLKHIYIDQSCWEEAYKTVDLMLLVYPNHLNELKDKGLLAYRTERLHEAVFSLNRYLFLAPKNKESAWVEERVKVIDEKLMQLN
jgi:regulator of sirC expression with transglutaminase-like and TPR domain